MPRLLDLVYVGVFAVVLPLWDFLVSWPAFQRLVRVDPVRARRRLWTGAILYPWVIVAVGAAIWQYYGRSWAVFGLDLPDGWRLWAALALVFVLTVYLMLAANSVAKDAQVRSNLRDQAAAVADVLPRTRAEMYQFGGVSFTAGFCEEFLFRGYFIWALSPWLGWWGAAALSVLAFGAMHAYQGLNGVLRTGVMGALFTLVVAIFGSLWPAILIHFLWDFGMGVIAWLALRDSD